MKILCIDDEIGIINLYKRILAHHEIYCAYSGEEAIKTLVKEDNFDLIISDINMPGLNGFDVIAKLQTIYQQSPPVIVVSGNINNEQKIIDEFASVVMSFVHKGQREFLKDLLTLVNTYDETYSKGSVIKS